MKPTKSEMTRTLIEKLSNIPEYKDALALVKSNAEGDIWLIGGIVSRLLIEKIYGIPQHSYDFDFLVERTKEQLTVPNGWEVHQQKHGNPTFTRNKTEIDIFPISTHHFIQSNNLEPNIGNFFRSVTFTIQALAFNINTQELIGDIGIDALLKREFRVNNLEEAQLMAKRKGITVNQRILDKAKSLGLTPILIEE
jgi:hypothetical protein